LVIESLQRHWQAGVKDISARMTPTVTSTGKSFALLLFSLVAAVAPLQAGDVTVFAAASLADSLKEIAAAYEKRSGDRIVFNFAASSLLARQIQKGAPADIFFSADEVRMDGLEKEGLIDANTRRSRLGNTLVVVVPSDGGPPLSNPRELAEARVKRIAIADPEVVPAGVYARLWLEKIQLWPVIQPKVVPTENVRAALAAVESGNVEAGIVYKTDAAISRRVKVVYEVPAKDGPDISYPVAIVKESKQPAAAKRLLVYLESVEAGNIFRNYGFIVRE
jgi:molybdate transport system substrate-binding protein